MFTHDLRQELDKYPLSVTNSMVVQETGSHNALDDARYVLRCLQWLEDQR
jgi:hypothetical protein